MVKQDSNDDNPGERLPRPASSPLTSRRNGKESSETDGMLREIESLQTRLSGLSEASRLVSESLDLDVVLQKVIDSARSLTGARYGALLTYEQSGAIQDFITSGISPTEIEVLDTLPKGLGLLGYINEIREPLRLSDISSHPNSIGFPENHPPMKTFLGMPIRHSGEHVGNIYLTEKSDGAEITKEDQEVLVMFASQAGAAISNARRYREQQQARDDLEALVNISPVGVLVFDGETGDLVSANDETRRIVGNVHTPGRSLSQLLEVMSIRRPDGSDIPVDQLPTMKALRQGENVLAEEVVIHLPDGRAVTTPGQCQADTPGRRRNRVRGGHDPGHNPAGRDEEAASGVHEQREPRTADSPCVHQGVGVHPAQLPLPGRPRREPPVPEGHRRADRPHAGSDQRPD